MTLLTVGLLTYCVLLGVRYWIAQDRIAVLNRHLSEFLLVVPERTDLMQGRLEAQGRLQEELSGLFHHSSADELAAIVASIATGTGVELRSMAVGAIQHETQAGVEYELQPMTLAAHGEKADVFRFLARLIREVPTTAVSGLKLSNLDNVPSAHVRLLFYLSPEASPEAEGKQS